jgi:Flp pilus assembly protein TadD
MSYSLKNALAIVILISLFSSCATLGRSKLDNMFRADLAQTKEAIKQGNASSAIGDLSMLLEISPQNREALFLRGLAYQKLNHFQEAVQDYTALLKLNDNMAKAQFNLAMIYAFQIHNYREALRHFDRFLSLKPGHPNCYVVGKIMKSIDHGPAPQYAASVQRIIEDTLTEQALIRLKGTLSFQERKKLLLDAARLNPEAAEIHLALGKTLKAGGEINRATEALQKALSLKPTLSPAHQELGNILKQAGRKKDSQLHFFKASLFESLL